MDFDLADALDDKNDGKDGGRPDIRPGEGTLTSPLHPTCHQPRCPPGPVGDPPRPLLGRGSHCQTPSQLSDGVRRNKGAALSEAPACSQHHAALALPAQRREMFPQAAQSLPPGPWGGKEPPPQQSLAERGSA